MTIEIEYDQLFCANNRNPEAATISAWDLHYAFTNKAKIDSMNEFWGFTGDPSIDNPRKRQIINQLGHDTFDIDIPAYEPEEE